MLTNGGCRWAYSLWGALTTKSCCWNWRFEWKRRAGRSRRRRDTRRVEMRWMLSLGVLVAVVLMAQKRPELNDGDAHGDAPFLVEDGWRPLLNGTDLVGW